MGIQRKMERFVKRYNETIGGPKLAYIPSLSLLVVRLEEDMLAYDISKVTEEMYDQCEARAVNETESYLGDNEDTYGALQDELLQLDCVKTVETHA